MKKSVKWYNNGDKEIQVSSDEKIPTGYIRGRLPREKKVDRLKLIISKETLYKDYIVDNTSFKDLLVKYGFSNSDLRVLISYYGFKKDLKQAAKNNKYSRPHDVSVMVGKKSSETQKNKWKEKSDEEKLEWSAKCKEAQSKVTYETKKQKTQKYLALKNSLSSEDWEEINKKRSLSVKKCWENNGDAICAKMKATEKENRKNRLCRSVAEQKVFDLLSVIYPDVIYDVRVDDRYPYYCDFYIPSKDLFIELNAHPSHGRLPIKYLDVDEYSKYPQKWTDVFYRRDVEKQEKAKKNNLNYLMIYPNASLKENIEINSIKYQDLIEKLYQTQK